MRIHIAAAGGILVAGLSLFAPARGEESDAGRPSQAKPEIIVPEASSTKRVTAGAVLLADRIAPGAAVRLFVRVRVVSGHHIYALDKSGTSNLPTSLEVSATELLRPDGPWRGPEPKVAEDGSRMLKGDLLFERRFIVQGKLEKVKVPIELKYQVCNEAFCWPPATIHLEANLSVVSSR